MRVVEDFDRWFAGSNGPAELERMLQRRLNARVDQEIARAQVVVDRLLALGEVSDGERDFLRRELDLPSLAFGDPAEFR